jgi:hypothetical protein
MRIKVRRPSHAVVVSYLALAAAMSGTAYAATGGTFTLGHGNSENKTSTLSDTAKHGPALRLKVKSGKQAPLAVSNDSKIAHLNADLVDGHHASAFVSAAPLHWVHLTLVNNWEIYDTSYHAPMVAKTPNGVVYLRGAMEGGATGSIAFTLPAGYRPAAKKNLLVEMVNSTAGHLFVDTDGAVEVDDPLDTAGAAQAFTSLDGVTFTLG